MFLERQAVSRGWGGQERAAAFHGLPHPQHSVSPEHPWWPRVFLLTQYSAQVCVFVQFRAVHAAL